MEKLGAKLFTVAMPNDPKILEQMKRTADELKAMFNQDGDNQGDDSNEDPNEELERRRMKNRKRKLKKKRSKENKRTKLGEEFENSETKITNGD